MEKEYDVFGIGNILVDYVSEVDDSFLKSFNLNKGEMNQRSREEINGLEKSLKGIKKFSGGSAPNVLSGLVNLGRKCILAGTIGFDDDGTFFKNDLEKEGIYGALKQKKGSTGVAVSLVTPDKERTFVVNYGVAADYTKKDLDVASLIKSEYLHFTGYEFESMKKTIKKAVKIAKKNNVKVSFDLGCAGVVSRNKKELTNFLKGADIVFANEEEAKVLTGKEGFDAAYEIKKICKGTAVVKLGEKGAVATKGIEGCFMPGYNVKAVNTIGAGDGFAAGFFYGLLKGHTLPFCTRLGNYYASKIIQQPSARLHYPIRNLEWFVMLEDM